MPRQFSRRQAGVFRAPQRPHASALLLPLALATLPVAAWAADADTPRSAATAQPGASATGATTLAPVTVTGAALGVTENTGSYTTESTNTATRLDLSPRETPQTVTIVTRSQIDDFRLQSVNDLLSTAAGVNVQRVESDRTYFSVRGFDVSNFQIDGLGLPFSTEEQMGDLDTALYDHVEVLKGANGLLANPGNPAATINFVRKRPTRDFQASASVSYGSWQTRRADIDLSSPLNESGSVRGRVIGALQKGNSYLNGYSMEKNVFGAIVEADIGSHSTAAFGYSRQENRPDGAMWGALPLYYTDGSAVDYQRSASTAPDWAYWNTTDQQVFAELATNWSAGWQSKLSVNQRELTGDAKQFVVNGVPDPVTGLGTTSYASDYNRSERQLLVDLYAKGPFQLGGRTHELMVGVNWARTRNHMTSRDDAFGEPLPPVWEFNGGFDFPEPDFDNGITGSADFVNYRRSLYAATHLSLTDQLKLIIGGNLTELESSGEQYAEPHDFRKTKLSPYFGAVYDLNQNYSVYASYTKIFNPQFKIDQSRNVLDPVEGNSVEVGLKAEWLDKRLNGSMALFRAQQDNTAEYAGFENGYSYYRGVDATSKGFELGLAGEIMPGWEINAGYTHLFSITDGDGKPVRTYIPKNTFYVGTAVRVPQVQGLKVGANVTWQSDIFRDQGVTASGDEIVTRQGSYAVLNLMSRYDVNKHVSVALNLNNVFDKKYINSLYWEQGYYAAPRNLTATLQWRY